MADHQEPYSNLEVAPTEHGTHAPEIVNDAAASAPERDFSSDTPTIDQEKWPLKDVRVPRSGRSFIDLSDADAVSLLGNIQL